MLHGTIDAREVGSEEQHMLFADGYDIAGGINLIIKPNPPKCRAWYDEGDVITLGSEDGGLGSTQSVPAQWSELVLSVGEVRVKLGYSTNERFRSAGINEPAFIAIASALREIKANCNQSTLVSEDAESRTYKVSVSKYDSSIDATAKLIAGEYVELEAEVVLAGYSITFSFDSDDDASAKIYAPKNGYSWRMNLGWSAPEPVLSDDEVTDDGEFNYDDLGDEVSDFYSPEEIQQRYPSRDYGWLINSDYSIVTAESLPYVAAELRKAVRAGIPIAFDTETTGLDIRFTHAQGEGDYCVGLIFSVREGQGWYIPVRMKSIRNIWEPLKKADEGSGEPNTKAVEKQVKFDSDGIAIYTPSSATSSYEDKLYSSPDDTAMLAPTGIPWSWAKEYDVVRTYFKDILERGNIVGHNVSFDWKVMWTYGINTNFVDDTMLIAHMGYSNQHRNQSVGLKSLTKSFLNRDALTLSDISRSGNWSENNFAELPAETVRLYGCADGDDTLTLYNYFKRNHFLEVYGLGIAYKIEVAFACVSGYQEYYGHHVDMTRADELRIEIENGIAASEEKMEKILGRSCNWGSSPQLRKALYEDLHYPILEYTPTGSPSTSKGVLAKLASQTDEEGNPKYPLVSELLTYRKWKQLKSNFVDTLDKEGTKDGYLFSEVNLPLETGRVSVRKPNYQSYNDTVKRYISPRHGYYMLDMDYSSVEYRILASMSGQENLIQNFKDPDTDYHTYQASRMFGVPYELVTSKLRHQAKGINFGLPYGMGDASLGSRIYGERNAENTRKAANLRKLYFEGQEKVEQFFNEKRDSSWEKSYAETQFGRRRYFDKRSDREDSIRREGGNMAIQGTAADIFKLGMVNIFRELTKRDWLGKFLIPAFVHDEALYEVANEIDPIQALTMVEHCISIDIVPEEFGWAPLYLGGGFGENWFHAKKTEIPIELQFTLMNTYKDGLPWWDGNIDRLYAWEVEQINRYYADRVERYLTKSTLAEPVTVADGYSVAKAGYVQPSNLPTNAIHSQLNGSNVNPQVNSYALDLMRYLSSEEGKSYYTLYNSPTFDASRPWVDQNALEEWIANGAPLGDTPVDQINQAAKLLGLQVNATKVGLKNPDFSKAGDDSADPSPSKGIHAKPMFDLGSSKDSLLRESLKMSGAVMTVDAEDPVIYCYFPESGSMEEFLERTRKEGTLERKFTKLTYNMKKLGWSGAKYPLVIVTGGDTESSGVAGGTELSGAAGTVSGSPNAQSKASNSTSDGSGWVFTMTKTQVPAKLKDRYRDVFMSSVG